MALKRQVVVFGIVGGLSTLTHFLALVGLVELGGVDPTYANLAAFSASLAVAFPLNHYFTFGDPRSPQRTFGPYLITVLLGLTWNQSIMWIGVAKLQAPYFLVFIAVTVAVAANNFLLSRYWAFKDDLQDADVRPIQ